MGATTVIDAVGAHAVKKVAPAPAKVMQRAACRERIVELADRRVAGQRFSERFGIVAVRPAVALQRELPDEEFVVDAIDYEGQAIVTPDQVGGQSVRRWVNMTCRSIGLNGLPHGPHEIPGALIDYALV